MLTLDAVLQTLNDDPYWSGVISLAGRGDAAAVIELGAKVRKVKTEAGSKRYGQPIGSPIVKKPRGPKRDTGSGASPSGGDRPSAGASDSGSTPADPKTPATGAKRPAPEVLGARLAHLKTGLGPDGRPDLSTPQGVAAALALSKKIGQNGPGDPQLRAVARAMQQAAVTKHPHLVYRKPDGTIVTTSKRTGAPEGIPYVVVGPKGQAWNVGQDGTRRPISHDAVRRAVQGNLSDEYRQSDSGPASGPDAPAETDAPATETPAGEGKPRGVAGMDDADLADEHERRTVALQAAARAREGMTEARAAVKESREELEQRQTAGRDTRTTRERAAGDAPPERRALGGRRRGESADNAAADATVERRAKARAVIERMRGEQTPPTDSDLDDLADAVDPPDDGQERDLLGNVVEPPPAEPKARAPRAEQPELTGDALADEDDPFTPVRTTSLFAGESDADLEARATIGPNGARYTRWDIDREKTGREQEQAALAANRDTKLPREQQQAVGRYTRIENDPDAVGGVNRVLRGGEGSEQDRADAATLAEVIPLYRVPVDTTVLRSVTGGAWLPSEDLTGRTLTEPGVMSTSYSGGIGKGGGDTVLEITVPAGTPAMPAQSGFRLSSGSGEHELMLPPGTRLEVTGESVELHNDQRVRWLQARVVPADLAPARAAPAAPGTVQGDRPADAGYVAIRDADDLDGAVRGMSDAELDALEGRAGKDPSGGTLSGAILREQNRRKRERDEAKARAGIDEAQRQRAARDTPTASVPAVPAAPPAAVSDDAEQQREARLQALDEQQRARAEAQAARERERTQRQEQAEAARIERARVAEERRVARERDARERAARIRGTSEASRDVASDVVSGFGADPDGDGSERGAYLDESGQLIVTDPEQAALELDDAAARYSDDALYNDEPEQRASARARMAAAERMAQRARAMIDVDESGVTPEVRERVRGMSAGDLDETMENAGQDLELLTAAVAESTRREQLEERRGSWDERAREYDRLTEQGMYADRAYERVYGVDTTAVPAREKLDIKAEFYEEIERLERDVFESTAYGVKGNYVNPEGERRGITQTDVLLGSAALARKYASEELREYWRQYGRITYRWYRANRLGETEKAATIWRQVNGPGW